MYHVRLAWESAWLHFQVESAVGFALDVAIELAFAHDVGFAFASDVDVGVLVRAGAFRFSRS